MTTASPTGTSSLGNLLRLSGRTDEAEWVELHAQGKHNQAEHGIRKNGSAAKSSDSGGAKPAADGPSTDAKGSYTSSAKGFKDAQISPEAQAIAAKGHRYKVRDQIAKDNPGLDSRSIAYHSNKAVDRERHGGKPRTAAEAMRGESDPMKRADIFMNPHDYTQAGKTGGSSAKIGKIDGKEVTMHSSSSKQGSVDSRAAVAGVPNMKSRYTYGDTVHADGKLVGIIRPTYNVNTPTGYLTQSRAGEKTHKTLPAALKHLVKQKPL